MQSRTTKKQGRTGWKVIVVAVILCVGVGLWWSYPVFAEIYKWQDVQGVVYYSNKPPTGAAVRMLEIISTQDIPVLKDAEGKAYYLNAPGGTPMGEAAAEAEFTISEEKFKELFPQSPATVSQTGAQSELDLSALTMRLAELENTLDREVENRVKWQSNYAQAQTVINGLEQQNELLKSSVARMEQDIATLRSTVIASDIQLSALKMPAPNQEVAMLTGQVTDMQTSVGALKQEMDRLQGVGVVEQLAALSATVQTLQAEQEMELGRVLKTLSEYQGLKFDKQQSQLEALLKKNESMEAVIQQQTGLLNMQNDQIKTIENQLAQLHQPVGQAMAVESGAQGGISVTPKIERRKPSAAARFVIWLTTTPQEAVTE